MSTVLTPAQFGFPAKFTSYRPAQLELVDYGLYGPLGSDCDPDLRRRIAAIGAPGGIGKTLASQTIGRMSAVKYAVLTATRALEDQAVDDGFDLVNIRGKDNYQCFAFDPLHPDKRWTCAHAGETEDQECRVTGTSMCTYGQQLLRAKRHQSVLTNYQYWFNSRARNRLALQAATKPIDLLICDEAHKSVEELARFLGTWVGESQLVKYGGKAAKDLLHKASRDPKGWGKVNREWMDMLIEAAGNIDNALSDEKQGLTQVEQQQSRAVYKLERLATSLGRVCDLSGDGNWIWQPEGSGIALDCIWPYKYAERYLFTGVKRVILISATLRPKLMALLGVKRENYDFREWPRQFPPHLSPVYWLPTVSMAGGDKMPLASKLQAVHRIDEIIKWAVGMKGIIHTANYKLASFIRDTSSYGRHMILNSQGRGDAQAMAEKFRRAKSPSILVSPSYSTGWDFAGSQCEFQIVAKLPFSDTTSAIAQARASDREYANYATMQDLVQACQRGSRHYTDQCSTFIIDDNIKWFQYAGQPHAPRWFKVKKIDRLPRLPALMPR